MVCSASIPLGRTQTKKRRADVPMCSELRKLLVAWEPSEGPVVQFRGKSTHARQDRPGKPRVTGLAEDANPYSLRHTVARWLRAESVPVWEVAALLGHKMPGHNVTELYAAADPQHMQATKQALNRLCVPFACQVGEKKMERAMRFELTTLTLAT